MYHICVQMMHPCGLYKSIDYIYGNIFHSTY
jgi:hypothetical protein